MNGSPLGAVVYAIANIIVGVLAAYIATISLRKQSEIAVNNSIRQAGSAREASEKSFGASVLSKNRQDWINSLRDAIAEFIGLVMHARDIDMVWANLSQYPDSRENKIMLEINKFLAKIELMINREEKDHVALVDTLANCLATLKENPSGLPYECRTAPLSAQMENYVVFFYATQ